MSESDLLRCVVEMALRFGYLVHHCRSARSASGKWATHIMGSPGFPDLVLVRRGVVLFVELKRERENLRPAQLPWRAALTEVGRYHLWLPSDWLEGRIEKVLR